jgi:hypothetical protein
MRRMAPRPPVKRVPPPAPPSTYSTGQAAWACGCCQQTIIRCIDSGVLAGYRVPGSRFRRVTRAALIEFATERNLPLAIDELDQFLADSLNEKETAGSLGDCPPPEAV